jgi:hypothetical protein
VLQDLGDAGVLNLFSLAVNGFIVLAKLRCLGAVSGFLSVTVTRPGLARCHNSATEACTSAVAGHKGGCVWLFRKGRYTR